MKLVITSAYNKSLHSIALMKTLSDSGHEIVGCLQVKTLQLSRFRKYAKQYGSSILIKKIKSRLFNEKNNFSDELIPIKKYMRDKNINEITVSKYCSKNNIKLININSLNNFKAVNFLKCNNVDLLVYSGGGILRKKIINDSKYGVINAHSGYLPYFRGMNVVEWSLLYKFIPYTTIHFIDSGIDTGNILIREPLKIDKNLYYTRGQATLHNIILLNKVLGNFSLYKNKSIKQKHEVGKQFFIMHNRLKNILIASLKKNETMHYDDDYENFK